MMRLLFFLLVFMACLAGRGLAQEEKLLDATAALQSVLSGLKQSVEAMSSSNNKLKANDTSIKQQIAQLQESLSQLQQKGEGLNKSAAQLQEKNEHLSQQITKLESQNYQLDDHVQKIQVTIKSTQEALEAGYRENAQLLLKLKAMADAIPAKPPSAPAASPEQVHRQKEKLKILKMIAESQDRQAKLHQAIVDMAKGKNLDAAAAALAQQQQLKQQVKDMEAQVAAVVVPAAVPAPSAQGDVNQQRQLEAQLKTLEDNYAQLKILTEQMGKRPRRIKNAAEQYAEEQKLQGSVVDLNRQSEELKVDLDDLRAEMVTLDKRKTRLEGLIRQSL